MPIHKTPEIEELREQLDKLYTENAKIGVALSEDEFLEASGMTEGELIARGKHLDILLLQKRADLRIAYLQAGLFELTITPYGAKFYNGQRFELLLHRWDPSINQTMALKEVLVSPKNYSGLFKQLQNLSPQERVHVQWLVENTEYLNGLDTIFFNDAPLDLWKMRLAKSVPDTSLIREMLEGLKTLEQQQEQLAKKMDEVDSESDEMESLCSQDEELAKKDGVIRKDLRQAYLQEGVVELRVSFTTGNENVGTDQAKEAKDRYNLCLRRWDPKKENEVEFKQVSIYSGTDQFSVLADSSYSASSLYRLLKAGDYLDSFSIILYEGVLHNLDEMRKRSIKH